LGPEICLGCVPLEGPIEARELADVLLGIAIDKKATAPALLEVGDLVGYCEYVVIVNARSARQVRAIANEVLFEMKNKHGLLPVGVEGRASGAWVLVDFDDVIVHVFQEGSRAFYDLEALWTEAKRLPVPEVPDFEDDEDDDEEVAPLFTLP